MKIFGKAFWLIILVVASLIFAGCLNSGATGDNSKAGNPTAVSKTSENGSSQPTPAPTPVKAQSNILFIMDSSGSMKARVEGKTKMDTAKEVLNELIGTLSPGTNAGLLAYGHREKDDCKDAELLVPVEPLQTDLFRQKVQNLEPLGQTPISYSLRQAAEYLKGKTGKKSIILISDGEETCNADPCKIAAELKKADVDVKIHVIGFGIEKESAKKQLHCIAEATGGVYKNAGNAKDLKEILESVARESSAESTGGNKGRLVTISLDSNGKPFPWCIDVFKTGTTERVLIDCQNPSPDLPPGNYDVWYYNGTALNRTTKYNIEIKAGQETRIEFEQAGRILVKALDQDGKDVDLSVQATPKREDFQGLIFSTNKAQELIPGLYDLNGYNGPLGFKREGVEVKSGQETLVEVTINR